MLIGESKTERIKPVKQRQKLPSSVFHTARLTVRRLDHGDFADLLSTYGDPLGARWVDDGKPISAEDCRKWIDVTLDNYSTRGYGMFALVESSRNVVIGFCGIIHPGGQAEPEIKYSLKQAYWGQGFATEAVKGLIAYAVEIHSIHHLISTVAAENKASINVLQKVGMLPGGSIEESDGSITLRYGLHL